MSGKELDKLISFQPQYKEAIWGGSRIAALKRESLGLSGVGECWEISAIPGQESVVANGRYSGMSISVLTEKFGEELLGHKVVAKYGRKFPLLIKIIDAKEALSLQVHPNDNYAMTHYNSLGKSEMWYIMDATPGACIYSGLKEPVSPMIMQECVTDGSIMGKIKSYTSVPGQFYNIPAGVLHAIGGGNLIAEVQSSCNITYRVYDHNRLGHDGKPRQLHLKEACEVMDFSYPRHVYPTARIFGTTIRRAVETEHLVTDFLVVGNERMTVDRTDGSFRVFMVMEGTMKICSDKESQEIGECHTVMVPACVHEIEIEGPAKVLMIYCK